MAENGLNLEEIRRQSRHKDYKTLLGYMELSDKHVKEAYMKGLSFDNKEIQKQESEKYKIPEQNLSQQLILKLANGEISNEVFLNAISLLKEQKKGSGLDGYI